jgi:hypothetical protein
MHNIFNKCVGHTTLHPTLTKALCLRAVTIILPKQKEVMDIPHLTKFFHWQRM